MSVFSVGGVDLLLLIKGVTYELDIDTVDGSPLRRLRSAAQPVKQGVTISVNQFSTKSGNLRTTNLDVTAMTIDSVDFKDYLRGGTFSGSYQHDEASAVKDLWKYPIITKQDLALSCELHVPVTAGVMLDVDAHSGTVADKLMTVSFTINGNAFTTAFTLVKAVRVFDDGKLQIYRCEFMGSSPDSGTYPAAPTGTTSLLEKCINDPNTALAVSLTSHATEGGNFSGNVIPQSFSISFNDGQIIDEQYTWISQGTMAFVAN